MKSNLQSVPSFDAGVVSKDVVQVFVATNKGHREHPEDTGMARAKVG